MNIFVLDTDPQNCARYHCNKHVIKMILETAQLLSTAHHVLDGTSPSTYKKTHPNHPCAKWVRETSANYRWTWKLLDALCEEYTLRYGKKHKTEREQLIPLIVTPKNIKDSPLTPWPQAMPDHHRRPDAVSAYRTYYKAEKSHFAVYPAGQVPEFMI